VVWLALALAGCGTPGVVSQVSSHGAWPADREPGLYVFERLPSQQAQPESQARLEAAAEPALLRKGFRRLSPPLAQAPQPGDEPAAEQPEWAIELAASVHLEPRWPPPPGLWPPGWGPRSGLWPGWPLVPQGSVHATNGAWGLGAAWAWPPEPPWATLQVRLLVRDRRSAQVLYETQASHGRPGGIDESALPLVFEAALEGFPRPPAGLRTVNVPWPDPRP
jgi:hypothetical protein